VFVEQYALKVLDETKEMKTRDEARKFDEALALLASSSQDISLLPQLLPVFTDNTAHQEVMWGLVHYVEDFGKRFGDDAYVKALVNSAHQLPEGWAMVLFVRIINHEALRKQLRSIFANSSQDDKVMISQILEKIIDPNDPPYLQEELAERIHFVLS
jgi:hypothetical protein